MDLAGVTTINNCVYCITYKEVGLNMDVGKHCPGQGLGWGNSLSKNHGYTLIELLVTLAVTSILALNIYPNLSNLIARERSTILTNTLAGALAYARSEAIKKNTTILTCQSNNGSECNNSENWHNGWIIFTDTNKNKQRDPEEMLLRVYAAADNNTQVTFSGSSGIKHYVKYKASGRASPNGSFLICNSNIGVGKALIIASSGRVRLSKIQTNGSTITCD
jgi:type IV fimbrial biogenesis protein FimT